MMGQDPLDESMDNMESLILNPPEFEPVSNSAYGSAYGSTASASQSYYSHAQDDDPLESDFHGFGQAPEHSLEPPSYTDALHAPRVSATPSTASSASSPGGSGPQAPATSAGSSSSSPSAKNFVFVKVTDPQKHLDSSSTSMLPGGGTYVSYTIVTKTDIPEYGGTGSFRVRRRFREFVALADRLAETHRGYFIPARPDKSVVENQLMPGKDFVEMRRVELEKYLQRLARHPAIQRSRELVLFLTAEGKLPLFPKPDVASRVLEGVAKLPGQLLTGSHGSSIPAPSEAVQPASGGRDLFRMFKELRQSVANDWTGGGGAAGAASLDGSVVVDAQEQEFQGRKHRLEELEKHLSEASIQAENLVRAQADLTRATSSLGMSFLALAKLQQSCGLDAVPGDAPAQPDTHRQLAETCRAGGSALVKEFRLHHQAVAESMSQLAQLHEYLKGVQAAKGAFQDRSQAVVTVQTLAGDLAAKKGRLERMNAGGPRPGDISRVKRAIEIEEEIDKAGKAKAAAEGELERIKERNLMELKRFDEERWQDMSRMLQRFANIQAVVSERTLQLWGSADVVPSKGKGQVSA